MTPTQTIDQKRERAEWVADRIRELDDVQAAGARPEYYDDDFRAFFSIDDGYDPVLARAFFMRDRSGDRVEAWLFLERGTIATGYRSLASRTGLDGGDGVPIDDWPDALVDMVAENVGPGTAPPYSRDLKRRAGGR